MLHFGRYNYLKPCIFAAFVALSVAGCNESSTSSSVDYSADASASEKAFPKDLMVASPTQVKASTETTKELRYTKAVEVIEGVKKDSKKMVAGFHPENFFTNVVDAECFGPKVKYQEHPDGVTGNTGELPSGDVGVWLETMTSGEVCAAAEMNAQLQGASSRVMMSLVSFAGLVAVANANSISLPTAGYSITLTTQMNALGLPNSSFNAVTISQSATGLWQYSIDFDFTHSSVTKNIVLSMEHAPGTSTTKYQGVLNYQMNDFFDPSGNCPVSAGTGADITHNGSLHYIRDGDAIRLQHRYAMLCGHGKTAFSDTITNTAGLTKKALHPAPTDTTTQWKNNFSILTASFDKTNLSGQYAYTWQAGDGDSDARILFVGLNTNQTGEGYYGYGDKVQTTTAGEILGFYCNWAGPGSGHTRREYAQRQHMTFNATTSQYEPTNSGASDITYSPNNACTYSVASGPFRYDRDIDSLLTDETEATAFVYPLTSPSTTPAGFAEFDLMDKEQGGVTYSSIMDVIKARGFSAPTYP